MNITLNKSHAVRSRLGVVGAFVLISLGLLGACPSARAQNAGGGGGKSVTINLQNAPVQTVLRSLFNSAGKNFTIDPGIGGTVTVDVNQVPFETALSAVLSGANPPLAAPLDNGIYHVQVDRPLPAAAPVNQVTSSTATAEGDTASTKGDPDHAYRIPIEHYDAAYMAYLIAAFSKKGGAPIIVPSDPNAPQPGQGGYGSQQGGGGYGGGGYGGQQGGFGGGFGGQQGGFGGQSGFGGGFGGNTGFGGGGGFGGYGGNTGGYRGF